MSNPASKWGLIAIVVIVETAPMMEAVEFWGRHGGSAGVWWAVAMPVVALFLWFQLEAPWQRWAIGGLASLTLLAAPLWQVAAPVLEVQAAAPAATRARQTRIELLQHQIAEGATKASTYLQNSATRRGWLTAIQANDAAMATARAKLADLLAKPPAPISWLSWAVAVIQALSLVLMHTASVIAIRKLQPLFQALTLTGKTKEKQSDNASRNTPKTAPRTVQERTETPSVPVSRATTEDIYRRLVAGDYGQNPIARNIRETERVSYPPVKMALERAEAEGKLLRLPTGFRLVAEEGI